MVLMTDPSVHDQSKVREKSKTSIQSDRSDRMILRRSFPTHKPYWNAKDLQFQTITRICQVNYQMRYTSPLTVLTAGDILVLCR